MTNEYNFLTHNNQLKKVKLNKNSIGLDLWLDKCHIGLSHFMICDFLKLQNASRSVSVTPHSRLSPEISDINPGVEVIKFKQV
jgi:hypothetical protein